MQLLLPNWCNFAGESGVAVGKLPDCKTGIGLPYSDDAVAAASDGEDSVGQ